MPRTLTPIAGATVGLALMVPTAHAQPSLTNLGTLTCTIAGAPDNPRADVKLSCNFKSAAGATRDYTGVATQRGAANFPAGKHVLVWTVTGPEADDDASSLNGTFRGETSGSGTSALIGGANGAVRLEPVTGAAQVDAVGALTVLTLTLAPTRA
jgi:hypothetical protein